MRYYYGFTDEEISKHSYPYLLSMYSEYPKRACENLGVSGKKKDDTVPMVLPDSEYPTWGTEEFKSADPDGYKAYQQIQSLQEVQK